MEIAGFSGPICAAGSSPSTLLGAKDEKDFISFLKTKKNPRSCIWEKGHCKRECLFHLAFLIFVLPRRHLKMAPVSLGNILLMDSLVRTE